MCFINKDNIERNKSNDEGTNLNTIVFDVCVFMFCFFVCVWIDLVDLIPVKRVYEKSFEMCIYLWQSLIVLKWPCVVDRVLKSK